MSSGSRPNGDFDLDFEDVSDDDVPSSELSSNPTNSASQSRHAEMPSNFVPSERMATIDDDDWDSVLAQTANEFNNAVSSAFDQGSVDWKSPTSPLALETPEEEQAQVLETTVTDATDGSVEPPTPAAAPSPPAYSTEPPSAQFSTSAETDLPSIAIEPSLIPDLVDEPTSVVSDSIYLDDFESSIADSSAMNEDVLDANDDLFSFFANLDDDQIKAVLETVTADEDTSLEDATLKAADMIVGTLKRGQQPPSMADLKRGMTLKSIQEEAVEEEDLPPSPKQSPRKSPRKKTLRKGTTVGKNAEMLRLQTSLVEVDSLHTLLVTGQAHAWASSLRRAVRENNVELKHGNSRRSRRRGKLHPMRLVAMGKWVITRWRDPVPLWKKDLRRIDGKFGSSVEAFFSFTRTLIFMNVAMAMLALLLMLPMWLRESWREHFKDHTASWWIQRSWLVHTPMFFPSYPNEAVAADYSWLLGEKTTSKAPDGFYIPFDLLWVLFILLTFVGTTVVLIRWVRNKVLGLGDDTVVRRDDAYPAGSLVYGTWDFSFNKKKSAALVRASIVNNIRELASQYRVQQAVCHRTHKELLIDTLWKVAGFGASTLIAGVIVAISLVLVQLIVRVGDDFITASVFIFSMGTVLSVAVIPVAITRISAFERWKKPRDRLYYSVGRSWAMQMAIIALIVYFLFSPAFSTLTTTDATSIRSESQTCPALNIGRVLWMILMMDTVRTLLSSGIRLPIISLVKKRRGKITTFELLPNTIQVMFRQAIIWIGLLISPGIAVLGALSFILVFYIKRWELRFCQPGVQKIGATRLSQYFVLFLCLTFAVCSIPMVVFLTTFGNDPDDCGPFTAHGGGYEALLYYLNTFKLGGSDLNGWIDLFLQPIFLLIVLALLGVTLYFLYSSYRVASGQLSSQNERFDRTKRDAAFAVKNAKDTAFNEAVRELKRIKNESGDFTQLLVKDDSTIGLSKMAVQQVKFRKLRDREEAQVKKLEARRAKIEKRRQKQQKDVERALEKEKEALDQINAQREQGELSLQQQRALAEEQKRVQAEISKQMEEQRRLAQEQQRYEQEMARRAALAQAREMQRQEQARHEQMDAMRRAQEAEMEREAIRRMGKKERRRYEQRKRDQEQEALRSAAARSGRSVEQEKMFRRQQMDASRRAQHDRMMQARLEAEEETRRQEELRRKAIELQEQQMRLAQQQQAMAHHGMMAGQGMGQAMGYVPNQRRRR
ncbi:transmembrane channel-like protein [Carpediemonas membranifera]|uniref:Transmembrane channel-like protein n=1 Tax=Carpediemonas membranifera TaxID=201153 RepID=A0A8J6DXC7_9EUKA|nr:transmembrane channel-like protein [Carpediemonas membranifera]|eukprot:KAG9389874.1 transmembrane channel-like protein [Carpediemonas membranifera]